MSGASALPADVLARRLGMFDLFAALTHRELVSLAADMSLRNFERGGFVLAERQVSDRDTYFVLDGCVRVCAYSENGRQVQFEELHSGSMFGELSAIDGLPRSGDCIAVTDSTLAVLSAARFLALRQTHPSVAEALARRLAAMVRRQMQKVFEVSTTTVNQRVRLELLRMASARQRRAPERRDGPIVFAEVPTHADLAARISTHREAISRELKALEALGVIVWRRDRHEIVDLALLTEIAHGRS